MIEFNKFTLSSDPQWIFYEFDSIIIGKNEVDGSKLQISSAYNHPTYFFEEHKDGLFIAKQFASIEDTSDIEYKILIDSESKVGAINSGTNNGIETYFYILNNGNGTVAVLQNGPTEGPAINAIGSMLSTIKYYTRKSVADKKA